MVGQNTDRSLLGNYQLIPKGTTTQRPEKMLQVYCNTELTKMGDAWLEPVAFWV
jgi:hypothetical protein